MEYLGSKHAGPGLYHSFIFEVANHDDLFNIINTAQASQLIELDTSVALILGMKPFSEVTLHHKKDPLFEPIWAAYREYVGQFMQRLKPPTQRRLGTALAMGLKRS